MRSQRLGVMWLVAGVLAAGALAAGEAQEAPFTIGELFSRGQNFVLPEHQERFGPDHLGRTWDFTQPDRGNFTFLAGVEDLSAPNADTLAFAVAEDGATLGWGNYAGKVPKTEQVKLWSGSQVIFDLRVDAEGTFEWEARFWANGERDGPGRRDRNLREGAVEGGDWQEVSILVPRELPRRDGWDIHLSAPEGTEVQLRNLRIVRGIADGYFRKEFDLPEGKIWKAVVTVGNQAHLYINGQKVPCQNIITMRPNFFGASMYWCEDLDITEYLRPGATNCVGLYGWRQGYAPYVMLQGSVILSNGERVLLDSDETWTWTPEAAGAWSEPGHDASAWQPMGTEDPRCGEPVQVRARWMLNYKETTARPVHDGYITLENPQDLLLYYREEAPVEVYVRAPNGLAAQEPVVEWTVRRYARGVPLGTLSEVDSGTMEAFEYRGASLLYKVRPGRLDRGVYTLHTRLVAADGTELDNRVPEPFVVTGRIAMDKTLGETYEAGMDLELEHEVDFTQPDTYPWVECDGDDRPTDEDGPATDDSLAVTEPSIVTAGDLTYRETRGAFGSQFATLYTFEHPGDFYLMVLEYPQDAQRWQGVYCAPRYWGLNHQYTKSGPSAYCGGRYPLSGEIETLKWVYRPDPGAHSLAVINLHNTEARVPAAASKLKIYHIQNGLPELHATDKHERWNGLLTERTVPRRFCKRLVPVYERDEEVPGTVAEVADRAEPGLDPVLYMCDSLAFFLDSSEAYARYMRFAGQNVHMMGCYQYSNRNTPFVPPPGDGSPRLVEGVRDVFARVLEANNIDFFASVEFCYNTRIRDRAREMGGMPDEGYWDTMFMVDAQGGEAELLGGLYGWNFNHPFVRSEMLAIPRVLAKKFAHLSNFRGINWTPYFGGDWIPLYRVRDIPDPLGLDYSDATVAKFERETGWQLPISLSDPNRFEKRHALLTSEAMRERWVQWRAESLAGFFSKVADLTQGRRADLVCVADLYMNAIHEQEWHQSGKTVNEFLRSWGWDVELFGEDKTIWLTHTMKGVLNDVVNARRSGRGLDMSGHPQWFDTFDDQANRSVQVKHNWREMENYAWALPPREGWPRPFQATLAPQPAGTFTREVWVRALIGLDPRLYFYGFSDATLFEGNEQPLREFNQVLRTLPAQTFAPVLETGFDTNLAIRELRRNGRLLFYVANPGTWPVAGTIDLEGAESVANLVTGEAADAEAIDGGLRVPVALDPLGVASFSVPTDQARITDWEAQAQESDGLGHLEAQVARARELLGTQSARTVLTLDDLAYMEQTVSGAEQALDEGRAAAALYATSSTKYWMLVNEYMEVGAKYGTRTEHPTALQTEPKSAEVPWIDEPPTIDAQLDDAVWAEAVKLTGFMSADQMPAMAETTLYAATDGENLYLAARCLDGSPEQVKGDAKREEEGTVFRDDCLAMFLQPDRDMPTYYQMAVNPLGVKFDQRVVGGSRDYEFAPPWTVAGRKTDQGWQVEVKLPAESLDGTIARDKVWGFNVHRGFRGNLLPPVSWSYTPDSWHTPDQFGELEF